MFEAIVAIWTIIMILLAGGSHGAKLKENTVQPTLLKKQELVSSSFSSPPSQTSQATSSSTPQGARKIPVPALLPGMVVFLGNVLRKRKTHS